MRDAEGRAIYRTRGDANPGPDPRTFALERATQPRYAFHIPFLGWVLLVLSIEAVRGAFIALPALVAGAVIARNMWRRGGALVDAQKTAGTSTS